MSSNKNTLNTLKQISSARLAIAISVCFTAIAGVWVVRYYFWQYQTANYFVQVGFVISISFLLAFVAIAIGNNIKNIRYVCYDLVRKKFINKILDYEMKGINAEEYMFVMFLSLIVNFLAVSVISTSILNPTSQASTVDLSFIPIIGDNLEQLLRSYYNVPLAMWLRFDFIYVVLFSSIGPFNVFLLRQIRKFEKRRNSGSYHGAEVLLLFLYTSPVVIFTSSLPPTDPYFFNANLSLAATLSAFVIFTTTIMHWAEMLASKFLKK